MVCSTQQGRGARARSGGCGPSGRWGGVYVGARGCGVGAGLKASGAGEAPSSTVPRRLPGAGTAVGGSLSLLYPAISLSLPPSLPPSFSLSLLACASAAPCTIAEGRQRRAQSPRHPATRRACGARARTVSATGAGGLHPLPLSHARILARARALAHRGGGTSRRALARDPLMRPRSHASAIFVSPHTAERVSASGGSESVPKERCVILGGVEGARARAARGHAPAAALRSARASQRAPRRPPPWPRGSPWRPRWPRRAGACRVARRPWTPR